MSAANTSRSLSSAWTRCATTLILGLLLSISSPLAFCLPLLFSSCSLLLSLSVLCTTTWVPLVTHVGWSSLQAQWRLTCWSCAPHPLRGHTSSSCSQRPASERASNALVWMVTMWQTNLVLVVTEFFLPLSFNFILPSCLLPILPSYLLPILPSFVLLSFPPSLIPSLPSFPPFFPPFLPPSLSLSLSLFPFFPHSAKVQGASQDE